MIAGEQHRARARHVLEPDDLDLAKEHARDDAQEPREDPVRHRHDRTRYAGSNVSPAATQPLERARRPSRPTASCTPPPDVSASYARHSADSPSIFAVDA